MMAARSFRKVAETVLKIARCGQDSNEVDDLADKVADYLYQITNGGIKSTSKSWYKDSPRGGVLWRIED